MLVFGLALYDRIRRAGSQPIVHRVGGEVDVARPRHGTVIYEDTIEQAHVAKWDEDFSVVAVDELGVVEPTARTIGKFDIQLKSGERTNRDDSPWEGSRYVRGGILFGGFMLAHSVQFSIREPRFSSAHCVTSFAAVRGSDPWMIRPDSISTTAWCSPYTA